ncbi:MAG: hypothetical protein HY099_05575, partial [Nitrospirae bacterium]|nr:hypothetical protein [Nitrospirota bacterium]
MEKKKAFLKVFCLPVIFILISASSVNAKNEASVYVSDKYGNQIATASGIVEKDGIVRTNCRIISKWLENLDYTL